MTKGQFLEKSKQLAVDFWTINLHDGTYESHFRKLLDEYEETKQCNIVNVSSSSGVIRQERGWAGHFICANRCRFRRNTLLTYKDIRIIVSTVGLMERDGKFEMIGHNRHFETMAFHSDPTDTRYYDADVSKQVYFDSEWAIAKQDADDKANEMHEAVVLEITNKLLAGATFPVTE